MSETFYDKILNIDKDKKYYIINNIPRNCDIISSFNFIGQDIQKIELFIGGNIIYIQHYLNAKMINFQPSINGIIYTALQYHDISLKIYCKSLSSVYIRNIYLPFEIRVPIARNPQKLCCINKEFIISNGMINV